jgi:hypothetical protein
MRSRKSKRPNATKHAICSAIVNLSDQEWNAIAAAATLPDYARERIENVMSFHRMFQQAAETEPRAAQTRKELFHIADLAGRLLTAILGEETDGPTDLRAAPHVLSALMLPTSRLVENADDTAANKMAVDDVRADNVAAVAFQVSKSSDTRRTLELLYEKVLAVKRLQLWFENAARSLPEEKRGTHRPAENHRWLVGQLDAILAHHTGRHINRSRNRNSLRRCMDLCFEAADPSVGSGSIDKAIEALVRLNPRPRSGSAQITKKKHA